MIKSDYTLLRSRASALWLCLLFLYILLLPTTAETGTPTEGRDAFVVAATSDALPQLATGHHPD
jgi:hypothetical protein